MYQNGVVAEVRHAVRVIADGAKHGAEGGIKNAPGSEIDEHENAEHGIVEDEVVVQVDGDAWQERNARHRNPDEPIGPPDGPGVVCDL